MAKKAHEWPRPDGTMVKVLDGHASRFPSERRKMFGHPCYFVNGNMFAGVFADGLFARFSQEDKDSLLNDRYGTVFEPLKGRKMDEYVVLSSSVIKDGEMLDRWLERSHAYVSSLRPKNER